VSAYLRANPQRAKTNTVHRADIPKELAIRPNRAAETDCGCKDGYESEAPMTIGEVANAFGMTLRALRFYEAKRLIAPQRHGTSRIYLQNDRERLSLILTGRRLGFTLAEIRELLDRPAGDSLNLTRDKCVEQINMLESQKRGIERALSELRRIYTSFYTARLQDAHP
jgi:DNA-binding transcriptional MerR regulator